MNPNDPADAPLDPDERELARVLRALPSGEPPPALDARILRAASAAAAAPARRRRGVGLLGGAGAAWGIGTAAAAVLALGIGWHALYGNRPLLPASAPVPVPQSDSDDSVTVDFRDHTSLADRAAMPPPPTAPPPSGKAAYPALPRAAATRAVVAPMPRPFPDTGLDEHVATRAEGGNAAGDAAGAAAGVAAAAEAPAPAREPQVALRAAQATAESRRDADGGQAVAKQSARAADLAAARAEGALAAASAPASTQAGGQAATPRLRPATWLAQVRALRDGGKAGEARARLVEFRRAYPHWVIPTDLAPLLDE